MRTTDSYSVESWKKFLNPDSLRFHLTAASLYLAAWETFKQGVMGRIKGFFTVGFNEDGVVLSEEYASDVLVRHKSPFRASMLWLAEMGAVDNSDIAIADQARKHRNDIAHDLPRYISNTDSNVDVQLLYDLCGLLRKIDIWWIRNVEIPINPDCDGLDTDGLLDSEIQSGNMLFLQIMLKIVSGDEAESRKLFEEFVRLSGKSAK